MNKTLTVLALTLICASVACEKKPDEPAEPRAFDRRFDGPVCLVEPAMDANLLKDQAKIMPLASPAAPPPPAETQPAETTTAPAAEATDKSIEAVKKRVAEVGAAVEAGQVERIADLFDAQAAKAISQMLVVKDLPAKMQAFEALLKDKLGMPLTETMKQELGGGGEGGPPGAPGAPGAPAGEGGPEDQFEKLFKMDELKFELDGANVVMTDSDGEKHKFANTPDGWKIQLNPMAAQMMGAMGELMGAQVRVTDGLTAGINDGSITKDNFEAKLKEMAEKVLKPVGEKFAKLMGEMMKKAFEGMGQPPQPGTPSAPAGTPTAAPAPTPAPQPEPVPTF